MSGRVYLVGAGPGRRDLITVRGLELLRNADVVVYDRLVNPELLEEAPSGCALIYAGKSPGDAPKRQQQINDLLVRHARAGSRVVRLKGGDPYVFGRGGEEGGWLSEHGVEWEYVPGVSSAVAGPGFAGIPVTHRGYASGYTVLTAQEDPRKELGSPDWRHAVALGGTLVVLMGAAGLEPVVDRLLAAGMDAAAPAAVVSRATLPEQIAVYRPLSQIAQAAREAGCGAPAILIAGSAVDLHPTLDFLSFLPLHGCRVVVTRPAGQNRNLIDGFRSLGAAALEAPLVETVPVDDVNLPPLDRHFDWVVYSSVNGVSCMKSLLWRAGHDLRSLAGSRIAAIGPETARAIEELGIRVDFVPARHVAEGMIEEFPEPVARKRILLPQAAAARPALAAAWRAAGAEIVELPLYETRTVSNRTQQVVDLWNRINMITFTSPSGVEAWGRLYPELPLHEMPVACIGPATAETAARLGIPVAAVAEPHTGAGLVQAVLSWWRARSCEAERMS